METSGDEREHELGEGGQKRQDVSEHHGPGGAVTDASGEAGFEGLEDPSEGQPEDGAGQLGGETFSQARDDEDEEGAES